MARADIIQDDFPKMITRQVAVLLQLTLRADVRDVHVHTVDTGLFEERLDAVHPTRYVCLRTNGRQLVVRRPPGDVPEG